MAGNASQPDLSKPCHTPPSNCVRRLALESAEAKWQQDLQQQPGGCVFESITLGWLNVLLRVGPSSTHQPTVQQYVHCICKVPAFVDTLWQASSADHRYAWQHYYAHVGLHRGRGQLAAQAETRSRQYQCGDHHIMIDNSQLLHSEVAIDADAA
jgi:hypothetical protein